MDDELEVVNARDVRAFGGDASKDRRLAKLRRGHYAVAGEIEQASVERRYRARVVAAGRARRGMVFALESALLLHGLPIDGEPTYIFGTGDPSASGARSDIRCSHLPIPAEHVVEIDGMRCSSAAWALADVARRRLPGPAVAALDAALRMRVVTRDQVSAAITLQSKQHRLRARWSLAFANPASESVGESRSRVAIAVLGFAQPRLQVEVDTRSGRFRSDFGWEIDGRLVLGEFDGAVKYGELAARSGRSGRDVLMDEKRREDALREVADVRRWTWAEVIEPTRLERVLESARIPRRHRTLPVGVRLLR